MSDTVLHILGSSAALPAENSNPSSQCLTLRNHTYMIDCGENTQSSMRRFKVNYSKMNHVFISHLHGDHCFGLLGLISTLDLLGRNASLCIHSHPGLKEAMDAMLKRFCTGINFELIFDEFSPSTKGIIYEDSTVKVSTFPLRHSIKSSGFLFKEQDKQRHIIREKVDFFKVPICYFNRIKNGEDYINEEGEIIPNKLLTRDADKSISYAYMSDTAFCEKALEYVEGVDLLFHEATFLEDCRVRAKQTGHSTASDAAKFAALCGAKKLVIGHFSARYRDRNMFLDEAKKHFENVFLGLDGKHFEF